MPIFSAAKPVNHTADLNSGTDVALCEAQVVKDTDDVTNADFLREVCFCNNNFHIFAATCSPRFPSEQRAQGGLFILYTMAMMLYNDAPLTTGAIIKLLKSRGLTFKDETKASHLFDHISYFRFKSYLLPLLQNKQTGTFKSGATFEDAYTLYKFDSALRKLICAEMEKIEISLRRRGGHLVG